MRTKYNIFISHQSKTKPLAERLFERFTGLGLNVFFDKNSINVGNSIPQYIYDAIEEVDIFIVIISAEWKNSSWCQAEFNAFSFPDPINKNEKIIPLLFEHLPIPPQLIHLKYLNFIDTLVDESTFNDKFLELTTYINSSLIFEFTIPRLHSLQCKEILNQPTLPWTEQGGPSTKYILPELYIDPCVKAQLKPSSSFRFSDLIKLRADIVNDSAAIIGQPGIGKTTLLKKVFLDYPYNRKKSLPIFINVRDLLQIEIKNTQSLLNFLCERYSFPIFRLKNEINVVIFIDGLDEIVHSKISKILVVLKKIVASNGFLWISCRRDFFFEYLKIDKFLFSSFEEVYELQEWDVEKDSLLFAKNYAEQYGDIQLFNKLVKLTETNQKLVGFLKRPFVLTLLLYLLEYNGKLNESLKNTFGLYDAFYSNWLKRENMDFYKESNILNNIKLHQILALELYSNNGKYLSYNKLKRLLLPKGLKVPNFSDSGFWSLLIITKKINNNFSIVKFWHETFGEFLVSKYLVESFLEEDISNLDEILLVIFENEVNFFIREAFELLDAVEKIRIYNKLYLVYFKHSSFTNSITLDNISDDDIKELKVHTKIEDIDSSLRIKEQIIYYIGRLALPFYPEILSFAFYHESNWFLKRIAALSSILYCNELIEKSYINSLIIDSAEDVQNRSVQLVYFGDVTADMTKFIDDGRYQWEYTRNAIFERLNRYTKRDIALRWWDLRTLRCFIENRKWKSKLSESEKITLLNCTVLSQDYSEVRNKYVSEELLELKQLLNI